MPRTRSTLVEQLSAIVRQWRSQLADLFNPYRPELHYMRGPGPRWHARHRQLHALRATAKRRPD
jgi:hypothetical protein